MKTQISVSPSKAMRLYSSLSNDWYSKHFLTKVHSRRQRQYSSIVVLAFSMIPTVFAGAVDLQFSEPKGTYDDPVTLTFSGDASALYYRIDGGGLNDREIEDRCPEEYAGQDIEIKDTSILSFMGIGDADPQVNTTDTMLNDQKYVISDPVYPNSVLRKAWLDAEAELMEMMLCEHGKVMWFSNGECLPDIDADNNGRFTFDEIETYLYGFHFWPLECPEGGDAYLIYRYMGWNGRINWPKINIDFYYQGCGINGVVIDGDMNALGLGTRMVLRQKGGRQIFDSETTLSLKGEVSGRVRAETTRQYNGLAGVEVSRKGTYWTSCNDDECAPNEFEVAYPFDGDSYHMVDPDAVSKSSCQTQSVKERRALE